MINKFETSMCPLCNKMLKLRQVSKVNVYDCPTQIEWNSVSGPRSKSHYEVEIDHKTSIQHVYAMPFGIDNFGDSMASRIYKMVPASAPGEHDKWQFVTEVPQIRMDTTENLLARIQKLLTFL